MDNKYTATVYNNNHVVKNHFGNDLKKLMAKLHVHLESANSGSYGIITDNLLDMVIQRYQKSAIED